MKYYRVYTNFTEYIPIDSSEIEKAQFAFITQQPVMFNNGSTSYINRIVPDFNRAMGWNPAHKLDAEDYNAMRRIGIEDSYERGLALVRRRVTYFIDKKQTHLIGTGAAIPELEGKPNQNVLTGAESLTKKLKM